MIVPISIDARIAILFRSVALRGRRKLCVAR